MIKKMTYYKSKNELELEEARKAQNRKIRELEEENRNLKSDLEKFSEAYKKYRDYEKEELAESCYDLERENKKLKERIKELEYLGDINDELKEENKKLKEERDSRKDEYKKAIDRENERVYNCNEYYAETMETRRKNRELYNENQKLKKLLECKK